MNNNLKKKTVLRLSKIKTKLWVLNIALLRRLDNLTEIFRYQEIRELPLPWCCIDSIMAP